MTDAKLNFQAELARFRQDPRVKLFLVMTSKGSVQRQAVDLVELAAAEIISLEERVQRLERQLAGLGALRVNPLSGGR